MLHEKSLRFMSHQLLARVKFQNDITRHAITDKDFNKFTVDYLEPVVDEKYDGYFSV